MGIKQILEELDAEIVRLTAARTLLAGNGASLSLAAAGGVQRFRGKGKMSAETRARIAAAQKRRWARARKG